MTDWQSYSSYVLRTRHSVVGNLQVLPGVVSPQLGNARDLFVYLPPSYGTGDRRYPVLYMHDGQNLFDAALSYAGEWQVDETMELLAAEGREAIVVGVPNMGYDRLLEYGPFAELRHGESRADAYLAFLAGTVKPLIDRDFRTLPDRANTGVAGSSMGGLISLYAFFRSPGVFGFVGSLSPALWFAERAIFAVIEAAELVPGKIYLDAGTDEGPDMLANTRDLEQLLRTRGYHPGWDMRYVEEPKATHCESAWTGRLRDALMFLLPRLDA